jgi:hypothetical protein
MRAIRSLLIAFAVACGPVACGEDPEAVAAAQYAADMQPVLQKNLSLAQAFLTIASKVKTQEVDGGGVAEQLARELQPLAEQLRADAAKVTPASPALADHHARLVQSWAERATAYKEMSTAWASGDVAAFDKARAHTFQSKLDEDTALREVNAWLAPHGVALDQYPSPP